MKSLRQGGSIKRVAFIIDHLGVGGVQEFLLNYCRYMRGRQHVTVVSIFGDVSYVERLQAAGAEVLVLTNRPYTYLSLLDPRIFLAFRRFYRDNQSSFDDIHLKLFVSFAYAAAMRLWRDPRVSAGLDANRNQLPKPIQFLFWSFAARYQRFYLNKLLWDDFATFGLRPERLLDQRYPVTRRSSETPVSFSKPYAFLTVGRGIPQKGHAEAIEFFKVLSKELDGEACLAVIGDGPAIDALIPKLDEDLKDKIIFTGNVLNFDDWLMGATGVVRLAFGEDVNSVIRESVLAGKIVATTLEGPGCEDLLERGLVVAIDRHDLSGSARILAQRVHSMTGEQLGRQRSAAAELWPEAEVFGIYE